MTQTPRQDMGVSDERLREMLAGLDGVTPGPWDIKTQEDWDQGFDFFDGPNGAFTFPVDGEPLDVAHMSRCDPDTMRSILTELLRLRTATPAPEWQGMESAAGKALSICDGIEQPAFEKWATTAGYDMHEHPMFYIFLDERTDAARMGWKAGIQHALDRAALPVAPIKDIAE